MRKILLLSMVTSLSLSGYGYSTPQAEGVNRYQRRVDLVNGTALSPAPAVSFDTAPKPVPGK